MMAVERERWQDDAECSGKPTEWWFAETGDTVTINGVRRLARDLAMQHCNRCPVANECLLDALRHRDEEGLRAGTTPRQRRKMLRY